MKNEMVYNSKISKLGMKYDRLDYKAMSEIMGPIIFNGIVRDRTMNDWKLVNGEFDKTVMADYIISPYGARFLMTFTNELVFYNSNLDMYIWATTHWGDDWSQILSDVTLDQFIFRGVID